MAYANGRIPKSALTAIPVSWSNKGEQEYLLNSAYESLSRMLARAVAETGSTFQIYDAYRSLDEQVAMLKKYYNPVNRARKLSTDRQYNGQTWAKKSGSPVAASPGNSNHGEALSVDIHPAAIQAWLRTNAARFGWVNDVPSESWHWSYIKPGNDKYKAEGLVDFAAIQKALGISADGKIGPGTVSAVKDFQSKNGLTVDGILGPNTKSAILSGKTSTPATQSAPAVEAKPAVLPTSYILDTSKTSANVNKERFGNSIKHITIHYWGKWVGQKHDAIVDYLVKERSSGTSAHYVLSPGYVSRIVPEEWTAWANGNRQANRESITIELNPDPSKYEETIATAGALVRDIRSRWGDLPLYPHNHWKSTNCPGPFLDRLDDIDAIARGGKVSTPTVKTTPAPTSSLSVDGILGTGTASEIQARIGATVDGRLGSDSWRRLQAVFGSVADGVISGQRHKASELGNGVSDNGWGYNANGNGSAFVRVLQTYLGVTVDGQLHKQTISALQKAMNADKNFLRTPVAIKKPVLDEDGRFGISTASEIQHRLGITVDGKFGSKSWFALQERLHVPADGVISGQRHKASELGNGITGDGWDYKAKGRGSRAVRALQAYATGVTVDGQLFESTVKQLQVMMNKYPAFLTNDDLAVIKARTKGV